MPKTKRGRKPTNWKTAFKEAESKNGMLQNKIRVLEAEVSFKDSMLDECQKDRDSRIEPEHVKVITGVFEDLVESKKSEIVSLKDELLNAYRKLNNQSVVMPTGYPVEGAESRKPRITF